MGARGTGAAEPQSVPGHRPSAVTSSDAGEQSQDLPHVLATVLPMAALCGKLVSPSELKRTPASSAHESPGLVDQPIPLERRTRVDLVALNVIVAQDALIPLEVDPAVVCEGSGSPSHPEDSRSESSGRRCREWRSAWRAFVLLRGEVVLFEPFPLDRADDLLVAARTQHDAGSLGLAALAGLRENDAGPRPSVSG